MKTVALRHFGSRVVQTHDAMPFASNVERIMHGIKNSLGVLAPEDVARIQSILAKYDGRVSSTSPAGISSFDSGKAAAAEARAGVERIQAINTANREFWDQKTHATERSTR